MNLEQGQTEMRARQQHPSRTANPVSDVTSEEVEERREKMKALRRRVKKQVGGARKSLESAKPALDFLASVIKGENAMSDKFRAAELLLDYSVADHFNLIEGKRVMHQTLNNERLAAKASAKADRARILAERLTGKTVRERARLALAKLQQKDGESNVATSE